MDLSNADLVKALRHCGSFASVCSPNCMGYSFCSTNDYFGLERIAADRIEQLEMDLENTRRCLGDRMAELNELEYRRDKAIEILKTIEWVGSGAKGRISDAIGILYGEEPENENDNMV